MWRGASKLGLFSKCPICNDMGKSEVAGVRVKCPLCDRGFVASEQLGEKLGSLKIKGWKGIKKAV